MSVLLEKGHSHARLYPIVMLWNEVEICNERRRNDLITLAAIMQAVNVATSPNHTKQTASAATKNLNKLIEDIRNGSSG